MKGGQQGEGVTGNAGGSEAFHTPCLATPPEAVPKEAPASGLGRKGGWGWGLGAFASGVLDHGTKEAPGGLKLGGGETAKGKADQGTVLGGLRMLHGLR